VTDPVETVARAAASALAPEYGPELAGEIEAALQTEASSRDRYADPVGIGALLVSIATLAWTVYTDLRERTQQPAPEVVARTVRVELRDSSGLEPAARDRAIEVVVRETVRVATATGPK
jgi:hypothetical protein